MPSHVRSITHGLVLIFIHDSLVPTTALKKKRDLNLLVTLSRLEVLLTRHGHTQSAEDEMLIESTVEELLRISHQYNFKLLETMTQHEMANAFPKSARRLGLSETSTERVDIRNYLYQMTQLNQTVAMALQLHLDVDLTSHKYIAHQLALLYLCLNLVGEPFTKYQAYIQQEFEAVKAVLSTANEADSPQLSDHHKQWLARLTSEIVNTGLFDRKSVVPKPIESLITSQQ